MNECRRLGCDQTICPLISELNHQIEFNLTETPHYPGERLMPESTLLAYITRVKNISLNCKNTKELNVAISEARQAVQFFFHPENMSL